MQKNYEKLSKKAIGCMMVNEVIAGIIFTAIACVLWFVLKDEKLPFNYSYVWLAVGIIWVICIAAPLIRYQRYHYRFSDEDIDMREGFLFVHRDIVPIERLHKIALESGPVDRIFGLAKVIVTTAGGDVTIRFIEIKTAEQIVDKLRARINQYAVEKRQQS